MADEEPAPVEGSPQPDAEQTANESNGAEVKSDDKETVSTPQADAEQPPTSEDAVENAEVAPDAAAEAVNEPGQAEAAETSADGETKETDETLPEASAEAQATGDETEAAAPVEGEGTGEEKTAEGEVDQTADVEKQEGEEGQSGEGQPAEVPSGDAEPGEAPSEGDQVPPAEGAEGAEGAEESEQPSGEPQDPEQAEESAEKPEDGDAETQEGKPAESEMPQSDTFADGEKPESPAPHVGEVLSREGSPSAQADQQLAGDEDRQFSPPVPDSPRESQLEEHLDVEELEEEIISPEQNREALVEMYHAAIVERENLQQQNHQLQHKLAEYFRKKKTDEQKSESVDKNEADQEQRYLKYMSQLEELRSEDQFIRDTYAREIAELEQRCAEKQQEVDAHRGKFVEFKHQVALNSLNSRSGKPIPPKDIEQYLAVEKRKDQEVIAVRLENIKLKNKLKKKEQQLKSKEELADGLHLIDFEQLKIENQTYNEKIEERNEELLKLRKKITNTVQVLTHLKEKLQFVQGENSLLKNKLKDVEGAVAQKRDVLTRTKQARDALRIDNHRLRQNCGLLGNEPLLRDFEERKDETDALKDRLERLKMQHAELTLNTASVRRKIEQIKSNERN